MKFYGKIGFTSQPDMEVTPGVYKPRVVELPYTGDVEKFSRKYTPSDNQNDELTTSNRISILSDLYLQQNWSSILYVVWNGAKLKITNVELSYPRITLDIGGPYNENKRRTS